MTRTVRMLSTALGAPDHLNARTFEKDTVYKMPAFLAGIFVGANLAVDIEDAPVIDEHAPATPSQPDRTSEPQHDAPTDPAGEPTPETAQPPATEPVVAVTIEPPDATEVQALDEPAVSITDPAAASRVGGKVKADRKRRK